MVRDKARNAAKQVSDGWMVGGSGCHLGELGKSGAAMADLVINSLVINRQEDCANAQVRTRVGSAAAGGRYREGIIGRNRGKSSLEGCQLQNDIRSSWRWNRPG